MDNIKEKAAKWLENAEKRLNEEAERGTSQDAAYWRGYRDALARVSREAI